jgi:hypothetical protein
MVVLKLNNTFLPLKARSQAQLREAKPRSTLCIDFHLGSQQTKSDNIVLQVPSLDS